MLFPWQPHYLLWIDADQVSDECVCVWRMLDYKFQCPISRFICFCSNRILIMKIFTCSFMPHLRFTHRNSSSIVSLSSMVMCIMSVTKRNCKNNEGLRSGFQVFHLQVVGQTDSRTPNLCHWLSQCWWSECWNKLKYFTLLNI